MNSSYFSQALTPSQLQALGEIVVESAWLERVTEHFIQKLCRLTREKTDALLERKMMDGKLEVLKMFARSALKDSKKQNEFSDLIAEAKKANTGRVTAVHGLWMFPVRKRRKTPNALADIYDQVAMARKTTSPGNFKTMSALELHSTAHAINGSIWKILIFLETNLPQLAPRKQSPDAALLRALRSRKRKASKPPKNPPQP